MREEREMRKRKQLIEELAKEDSQVLALSFTYAKNLQIYGEDVTEKWITAVQNADALEKAYQKGYFDALKTQEEIRRNEETEPLNKYHTCGRCKFEYCPEYKFPCSGCIHCDDIRPDLWEAKEDE